MAREVQSMRYDGALIAKYLRMMAEVQRTWSKNANQFELYVQSIPMPNATYEFTVIRKTNGELIEIEFYENSSGQNCNRKYGKIDYRRHGSNTLTC